MITGLMRGVDLPPVWLVLCLGVVKGFDVVMPWGLFGPAGQPFGAGLVGLGLGLMLLAVIQMLGRRTPVMPRRAPAVLMTGGVFGWTRNPIYLGDVLVLGGAVLWWDVPVAVPMVLGFMLLIQHRFILPEEAVLRARFGAEFDRWSARTARWIGRSASA